MMTEIDALDINLRLKNCLKKSKVLSFHRYSNVVYSVYIFEI